MYGLNDEMEVAYVTLQGVDLDLVRIVDDDEEIQGMDLFNYRVKTQSDSIHEASWRVECLIH